MVDTRQEYTKVSNPAERNDIGLQWIVVYRPHGKMNIETQYFGPFDTWDLADDYLTSLPAVGYYDEAVHAGRHGVKYTQSLIKPGEQR